MSNVITGTPSGDERGREVCEWSDDCQPAEYTCSAGHIYGVVIALKQTSTLYRMQAHFGGSRLPESKGEKMLVFRV